MFDRNRGNILAAQGALIRATQEVTKVRNDLRNALSDAYERYENNRVMLEYYRVNLLPDQARTYRGVYSRHQGQPDEVGFSDVIVAQQNLLNSITTYMTSLSAQWVAVTDVAGILQLNTLDEMSLKLLGDNAPANADEIKIHEQVESVADILTKILSPKDDKSANKSQTKIISTVSAVSTVEDSDPVSGTGEEKSQKDDRQVEP